MLAALRDGTARSRERFRWERTVEALGNLLGH